ncbi:hypothetical protein [Gordonia sihwensis]|uniref:hypothetical protein n=1 Tax=Gordonia sihwensis TaxID=173559 RepID=UPI003D955B5F
MTAAERRDFILPGSHCENPADWTMTVEYDPGNDQYEVVVRVVDDDGTSGVGNPRAVVITGHRGAAGTWVMTQDRNITRQLTINWQPDCQDHLEAAAHIAQTYCIMRGWAAA